MDAGAGADSDPAVGRAADRPQGEVSRSGLLRGGLGGGLFRGKAWFWWPWPLLVIADLWSKHAVFTWMGERFGGLNGEHLVFRSELLTFCLVTWENPGTIWGLFQDGTIVLMVLRCAAVLVLLWFVATTPARLRMQQLVLSLIFAGAIGNLYDNFTRVDADRARSVRDFLRFSGEWPTSWGFPAFNVADSCITIGAICLLWMLMREEHPPGRGARQVSSGS
ncbi:MAG: signal peptidase II [Planctomycetota bacterium]